jgi:PilZ domain-containing protein
MRKNSSEARIRLVVDEQRHLPRKRVLLSGVIADGSGKNAVDCVIRDINVRGAQIQSPMKLQLGEEELFLLNTRNEIAHLATVAWIKSDRAGLSFVRSYSLEKALPPQLEFLWKLFLDAKFRQISALIERGVPVAEASSVVGLTEHYLERCVKRGAFDEKVELLLHQAKHLLGKD